MAVNPSPVTFTYLKNSGIIPNTIVSVTPIYDTWWFHSLPTLQSKPAWLNVILDSVENEEFGKPVKVNFKIAIDGPAANNLPAGFTSGEVKWKSADRKGNNLLQVTNTLQVTLRVLEDTPLSLSQSTFNFSHIIGDPAPASQFLTIDTSRSWSIVSTESWLSFSAPNGTGQQVISLSVNPSGLSTGIYTSTFLVDDGNFQKTGTVNFRITGSGDENDYLNVSPAVLEFSETYLQPSASESTLQIDTSLAAVVSSNVNWLTISEENISAGFSLVTISTTGTNILQIGSYPAEIRVTSNYSVRIIYVLLHVVEVTSSGIESNGFYFAEDRNTLVLTTGTNNAEAVIDFRTLGTLEVKYYQKRIPFYRNSASVIVGLETSILLRSNALPELATQAFNPVNPIKMDFTVFDKSMTNAAMVERENYSNVRFLNGRSPKTSNVLTYLPSSITVPKDAVIAFSFIDTVGVSAINITGAVTSAIPIGSLSSTIYGIMVNLGDLTLATGDKIVITCGPVTVNIQIKPTELSTHRLIYLNEWDCPEVFNVDGPLEVIYEDESTTSVTNRAGKDYSSILQVKQPKRYKVGTGNIYTDAEVLHLSGIMHSKKTWLEIDGEIIEVIKSYKNQSVFQSRRNSMNFNLTFDAAIK